MTRAHGEGGLLLLLLLHLLLDGMTTGARRGPRLPLGALLLLPPLLLLRGGGAAQPPPPPALAPCSGRLSAAELGREGLRWERRAGWAEARGCYELWLERAPGDPAALLALGRLDLARGDPQAAAVSAPEPSRSRRRLRRRGRRGGRTAGLT